MAGSATGAVQVLRFIGPNSSPYAGTVDPYLVLAQSALETGNFTSALFVDHKNAFGMRPRVSTPHFEAYVAPGNYAGYDTVEDSVADYWARQYRFGIVGTTSPLTYALATKASGYATATDYVPAWLNAYYLLNRAAWWPELVALCDTNPELLVTLMGPDPGAWGPRVEAEGLALVNEWRAGKGWSPLSGSGGSGSGSGNGDGGAFPWPGAGAGSGAGGGGIFSGANIALWALGAYLVLKNNR